MLIKKFQIESSKRLKMFNLTTPHKDKLVALANNKKLPLEDKNNVEQAIIEYKNWRKQLESVTGSFEKTVTSMVKLLNEYKFYIDVNLIFSSKHNFLYRQKGQLKLDNTIIEEFLPLLVSTALADLLQNYELSFGPTTCFSGIRFESSIITNQIGGGMEIKSKAQDFAITRKLFIQASHQANFEKSLTKETNIAYVATECKTNLDKTMFQEAAATALDVKRVVFGAKYYLLCEWLDMTPIDTNTTAIDEILILRKAKRLPSNIRKDFNTVSGRKKHKDFFINYLQTHPFSVDSFIRFLTHIKAIIDKTSEDDILTRGYF